MVSVKAPMKIAITVSVFGARKAKSRAEGAALSGMFVLGIAALFTPLGIVSALTVQMPGEKPSAWTLHKTLIIVNVTCGVLILLGLLVLVLGGGETTGK